MYDKLNKENIITKNKELIFELALLINKEKIKLS